MKKPKTVNIKRLADEIDFQVRQTFRTFGGGKTPKGYDNPIATMLKDFPATFAGNVNVREVVEFVLLIATTVIHNAKPRTEWHEDMGPVLWWKFPVVEPPYVGTPLDTDWPDYHTHWSLIPIPNHPEALK